MSNLVLSHLTAVADWQLSRWAVSYAVNALWQLPMVAAAAWAVAKLVRRAGPRAEHMLWVGALLVMIALPAVPRRHWQLHPEQATVMMGVSDIDLASLPAFEPVEQPLWDGAIGLATLPRAAVLALLLGYLGVGLYFALRLGWSLLRTQALVSEAEPVSFDAEAEAVWSRCCEAFGLRTVRRLVSDDLACPVAVGRATVLVPSGFAESVGAAELTTAMAHECAHVRRGDFWKNVGYEVASLPVAFHPVLWMVKRQIAETREMVCDGAAVERVVPAGSYVRSLLRLAEGVVAPVPGLAAMGMFDGRTLERRIVCMRSKRVRVGGLRRGLMITAAVLAAVGVVAGGTSLAVAVEAKAAPVVPVVAAADAEAAAQPEVKFEAVGRQSAAATVVPQAATDSSGEAGLSERYKKWLDSVRGTISGQERESFLQLKNDEERDAFEAAFLQRHGGEAAGGKEQARRVAYANAHFGYGSVAGENSDRGHLYIRYGRPDEVTSHANGRPAEQSAFGGQTVTSPYEVWRYGHIDGVGSNLQMEFVDECDCGEYHAVPMHGQAQTLGFSGGPLVASLQPLAGSRTFTSSISAADLAKEQAQMAELLQQRMSELKNKKLALTDEALAKLNEQLKALSAKNLAGSEAQRQKDWTVGSAGLTKQKEMWNAEVKGWIEQHPKPTEAQLAELNAMVARLRQSGVTSYYAVKPGSSTILKQTMPAAAASIYKGDAAAYKNDADAYAAEAKAYRAMQNGNAEVTATGSNTVQRLSGGVEAGNRISGDEPAYPPIAKAAHVQGSVVLHAIISKEGTVENLSVISGPVMLQNAAMEAVRTWHYRPYLLKNEPTAVETTITVNFTMSGDAGKPAAPVELPPQGAANYLQAHPALLPVSLQADTRVYRTGGDVSAPRVLRSMEPEYTEDARKDKVSGTVMVALIVDQTGRPQGVHVVHQEGAPEPLGHGLEAKAVEAVQQYRFAPAMRNGQPVAAALNIEVDFQVF